MKKSKVETLTKVVLRPEIFNNVTSNCLILKLFSEIFFSGGIGFNIRDLASAPEFDDEVKPWEFIWLVGELLNAENLQSLIGFIHLRS